MDRKAQANQRSAFVQDCTALKKMNKMRILFLLCLLTNTFHPSFGQFKNNVWCFGDSGRNFLFEIRMDAGG